MSKVNNKEYLRLGASVYVPSIHKDIIQIANGEKINPKSIIFCTEDSISDADLPLGLKNIEKMLKYSSKNSDMLKFIRVRNAEVFKQIIQMDNIQNIDGFVFPKITAYNINNYIDIIKQNNGSNFFIMPTLETKEAFDIEEIKKLREFLLHDDIYSQVLSLRIGGNDLLNILGIRRSRYRTIYETPLGVTISNLVTIFKPYGFNLTAPVCELLQDNEILQKEIPNDLEHGLFGKTAIHPNQIQIIESAYMVSKQDYEMASAILKPNAEAVFQMYGVMCEIATHKVWAQDIIDRSSIYGVLGSDK